MGAVNSELVFERDSGVGALRGGFYLMDLSLDILIYSCRLGAIMCHLLSTY